MCSPMAARIRRYPLDGYIIDISQNEINISSRQWGLLNKKSAVVCAEAHRPHREAVCAKRIGQANDKSGFDAEIIFVKCERDIDGMVGTAFEIA